MNAKLFVEGAASGPDSKSLQSRCREGFRKLLEKCGLDGRMPQIVACGSRAAAYKDFCIAHANAACDIYVALLVDSEDSVANIEQTWTHLNARDQWAKPETASDDQVLMMTTCMETWIVSDRATLESHYGADLQVSALPALQDMEGRSRQHIQRALRHATRNCRNRYEKGEHSFVILAKLNPDELRSCLPSFVRCERILREKLN